MSDQEYTPLNVKMLDEVADMLREVKARNGWSYADTVGHAIRALHLIDQEVGVAGRQLRINPRGGWSEYIEADFQPKRGR